MFAFLFLLFPVCLIVVCLKMNDSAFLPVVLTGTFSAIAFCAAKFLFMFMHRVVTFSFVINFFYIFCFYVFLPVAVVYILFFFISKNDLCFRLRAFFPLVVSFYMIFLPFQIICYNESAFSFYEIFAKPFLYLVYFFGAALCVWKIGECAVQKRVNILVEWSAVLLFLMFFVSCIEALWLIGTNTAIVATVFFLFVAAIAFLYVMSIAKKDTWLERSRF